MEVDDTQAFGWDQDMDMDDTQGDKDRKDEETTKVNEQAQDKKDTKLDETLDHTEDDEQRRLTTLKDIKDEMSPTDEKGTKDTKQETKETKNEQKKNKKETCAKKVRKDTKDTKGTKAKAAKKDGTDKDDTAEQEKPDHVDLAFSALVQNMKASNIGKATTTPQGKRLVGSSIGDQQIELPGGQPLSKLRRTETSALDTRSSSSMNAMASGIKDGQRVPTPDAALKADLSIALAAAVETRTAVASTEEPMTLCKDTNISEAETQPSKANASASGVQLALKSLQEESAGHIVSTIDFKNFSQPSSNRTECEPHPKSFHATALDSTPSNLTLGHSTPCHCIPLHPTLSSSEETLHYCCCCCYRQQQHQTSINCCRCDRSH